MKKLGAISTTLLILISALSFVFLPPNKAFGKTDLSITDTDITFSNDEPLDGDTIRIFARVFNIGDTDVRGFVSFLNNGKEIADPQSISIKTNTYDDVFIDWQAKPGSNKIEAKTTGLNPADDNPENNKVVSREYFVDLDTDSDGIGNVKDPDDDNDGVPDAQEAVLGTNPLSPDTDGDKVNDGIDAFPLDKTESRDTDKDGVGDNKSPDADGDGLTNEDEIYKYGTNPLNPDTDGDRVTDKQEITKGTDPNKTDTDDDGIIDSEDSAPLDASLGQASLIGTLTKWFEGRPWLYAILGALAVIITIFIFRRKKD